MSGISSVNNVSYSQLDSRERMEKSAQDVVRSTITRESHKVMTGQAQPKGDILNTVNTASGNPLESLLELRELNVKTSDNSILNNDDKRLEAQKAEEQKKAISGEQKVEKQEELKQQKFYMNDEDDKKPQRLSERTKENDDYTIGYNSQTSYNISKTEQNKDDSEEKDEREALNLDKQRTLDTYQTMAQENQKGIEQEKRLTTFYM